MAERAFSDSSWLRVGLLLFLAQALALGLQTVLMIDKERNLMVGIVVSRIDIAADQIQAAFARASANGLLLAESRGLDRLLLRLQADDGEVAAIRVFDADSHYHLFASGDAIAPLAAKDADAILREAGTWSRLEPAGPVLVGRRLVDAEGRHAGGVLFVVRSTTLDAPLQAARDTALPRLLLTLAGVAAALPLLLGVAARFGQQRFALRTRLLTAALLLATGSSLSLSLQALPSFSERLAPALDAKAHSLAVSLADRVGAALAIGIPFERLSGVEAYFEEALAHHPEILALELKGPGRAYTAARPGNAGSTVEVTVPSGDSQLVVQLHASTDADVVARELRNLAADLAIVFLVAVVLFNEVLGAILSGGRLVSQASRARLGLARLAVFLLILAEELTRAFLPLYIASLARAGGETGAAAVALPISAYMASFALLTPFAGRWAERFGVARTFALGTGLSAVGFGWALAGGGYVAFVAARCLCAAGYAIGTMAMQQYFLRSAGAGDRTRSLALFVGAVPTAAICGAPIGGLLAEQFGPGAVFAVAAGMSLLALAVQGLGPAPLPIATATASPSRLVPVLGRRGVLVPLLTAALPVKLALAGFLFYLVPLALQQEGYGSGSTGRAMMLYFLLVAASNPLASWLSDRFGWQRELVMLGGLVIGGGGLAGLVGGSPALIAGIATLGIGTGLSAASLQSLVSREGPAALVLLRTVERLGAMIGPLLAGSLLVLAAYGGVMATIGAVVIAATLVFAALDGRKGKAP